MASSCLQVFLFVFVVSSAWAALPGGLKGCKQSSADYSKCLGTQTEKAILFFKGGNKKLGVDTIDPLKAKKLLVDQGTGPVSIKLEFRDVAIHGLQRMKVLDVKNDWKTLILKIAIPVAYILGDYTIAGKVLVLPIQGTGKSNITMDDLDVTITLKLKELKNYFQAESVECIISPKKTHFNLTNLFNGDKALGDNMNLFLNENHDQIVNELKGAISSGLAQSFGNVANQVLSKMPLNEIKLK